MTEKQGNQGLEKANDSSQGTARKNFSQDLMSGHVNSNPLLPLPSTRAFLGSLTGRDV